MKGLETRIDLSSFSGSELIQLCLGIGQVQLHFSNRNSINVESTMIVSDGAKDVRIDNYGEGASLLAAMLGLRLLHVTRQEDGGVLLLFQDDRRILVLNDSRQFESLQVLIDGQVIVG